MPENGMPGPVCDLSSVKESVCIHTKKILDGCRDKDCVEDLRFYPTQAAQEVLSGTQIIKGGCAELLYVYTDVEPITFNRGFYSIDMRYFYRVTLQVATGTPRSTEVEGLCVFDKRCILFGSEGSAKSFSSDTSPESIVPQTGLPTAVVEAVDPIVLDTRIVEDCTAAGMCEGNVSEIPAAIEAVFASPIVLEPVGTRRYFVTLGQFSLVRLERDTQLLIPAYDYCIPQSDCSGGDPEDPCGLFKNVSFPVNEFFPPNTVEMPSDYNGTRNYCACH